MVLSFDRYFSRRNLRKSKLVTKSRQAKCKGVLPLGSDTALMLCRLISRFRMYCFFMAECSRKDLLKGQLVSGFLCLTFCTVHARLGDSMLGCRFAKHAMTVWPRKRLQVEELNKKAYTRQSNRNF
jgi:hypothetical protein